MPTQNEMMVPAFSENRASDGKVKLCQILVSEDEVHAIFPKFREHRRKTELGVVLKLVGV